jgi:hypothetical protein
MDRTGSPGNVVRWVLLAAVLGLMAWTVPDHLAAERQPLWLEVVGIGMTAVVAVLAVLLVRRRHGTMRERLPLALGLVSALLLQGAIDLGFSGKSLALLAVWAVAAWVEWRRVDRQEREQAA